MASGNLLAVISPQANEPPSSAFATLDTRNALPCLFHLNNNYGNNP